MTITDIESEQREAFAHRLVADAMASLETLGVWLGLRLGLYDAIDRAGASTAAELASNAGIDSRYAREWLEQQAVAGVLVTTDAAPDADSRRYELPHREVLLDEVSLYFVAPMTYALSGVAGVLPELHARLQADPPARVADIACGAGWASIALAQGYPKVLVDGFDLDEESIRRAKRNAAAAGVDDRVSFAVRNAADPGLAGRYDAALLFEALHDLARPVEVLAAIRALLAGGGCLIVGDEKVAETFTAPGDEVERLLYGFSVLHCLPASRTETPSAATGTVLREGTLRAYASEAGFREVTVLPVENDMWRFYRLES